MIDEMTNPALIGYVVGDENATEAELELAERLGQAIHEIETLVQVVQELRAAHGTDS